MHNAMPVNGELTLTVSMILSSELLRQSICKTGMFIVVPILNLSKIMEHLYSFMAKNVNFKKKIDLTLNIVWWLIL